MTLSLKLGLGLTSTRTQGVGVPQFIIINGQRGKLLVDGNGTYLTGTDGSPLYGKAA